jgi:hypothetical protein
MTAKANVSGQAYAFMAMTPIRPGEEEALSNYLRGLYAAGPSPFERLPRTHLARFVIVPDFHNDASWKQRREEHLDVHYVIFTSNLDGDLDSYLDELCGELAPEAQEIWGRCIGCPEQASGDALKRYLKHNQIDTGIFFAAYPDATTTQVKRCLRNRDAMIEFARTSQGLDAAALQQRFLREFGDGS